MNTEIAVNNNDVCWDNLHELQVIKELYAKGLTDRQFECFVGLGRAGNLSPFNREIWCVLFKGTPQIFIGRDGYRKIAQSNQDYEYHRTDAVYSTDTINFENGEIKHSWTPFNRKGLLGAYCIVKRKYSSNYSYVYVKLEDYDKDHSLWKTLKETMIQKVAEAQALRQAFHEMFKGTYHHAELLVVDDNPKKISSHTDKLKSMLKQLLNETAFTEERLEKALEYYSVNSVDEMNELQKSEFIEYLEKIRGIK